MQIDKSGQDTCTIPRSNAEQLEILRQALAKIRFGAIQLTELARILEHQRGKRGANEIKSTMDDIKTMFERIVQFSEQTKDNGKFE